MYEFLVGNPPFEAAVSLAANLCWGSCVCVAQFWLLLSWRDVVCQGHLETYKRITKVQMEFPDFVSEAAKDFISKVCGLQHQRKLSALTVLLWQLLVKNSNARMHLSQVRTCSVLPYTSRNNGSLCMAYIYSSNGSIMHCSCHLQRVCLLPLWCWISGPYAPLDSTTLQGTDCRIRSVRCSNGRAKCTTITIMVAYSGVRLDI